MGYEIAKSYGGILNLQLHEISRELYDYLKTSVTSCLAFCINNVIYGGIVYSAIW